MAGDGTLDMVSKWLVVIGGLNWGLTGLGGFINMPKLNVVWTLLGGIANGAVANIVYVLVGLSAAYMLLGMFKK